MRIVVLKIGGKLLNSPSRIQKAARFILAQREKGLSPVVVASAPGRVTDYFLKLAHRVANSPQERELDMLLSVGERLGISLLAMAINDLKPNQAVSFTGSQVGIITDTQHTAARILEVRPVRLISALQQGLIPIIAGFQGVSIAKEITTLGRGGSDYTAVALAAALKAETCLLVKETGGLYSADPLLVPEAVHLPVVDYATLENFSSTGARIVQDRASSLARTHQVPLTITDLEESQSTKVVDQRLQAGPLAGFVFHSAIQIRLLSPPLLSASQQAGWEVEATDDERVLFRARLTLPQRETLGEVISAIGWGGELSSEIVQECEQLLVEAGFNLVGSWSGGGQAHWILSPKEGLPALRFLHQQSLQQGWLEPPRNPPHS